ncbi:putative SNAP25 homologous protein SNAP30 [Diospyros lotus]|uniref:putative SNAP25 homologous protein SNAP30 n=1 Tax=Diospyros lotus TaxID=55363 RepID=UPI00225A94EA|nr:putative SNAP25 homologous protein SNAP30 [Diospyros lotus]
MFGFLTNKGSKQKSVDPGFPGSENSNPLDSDTETNNKQNQKIGRTSSEPVLGAPNSKLHPFDDDDGRGASSTYSSSAARNRRKNGHSDSEDLDSMSMQELESYAVNKAEDTTKSVNNCLRIAEDIREDATRTLDTLNQQGEQIQRTHMMVADTDKDLSKGEKLLGSLGGMFSMTWTPKKTRDITGPVITKDDNANAKGKKNKEQRQKLGLDPAPKARSASQTPSSEPSTALEKVEVEKAKQDDALSDLSDILGDLKGMAIDMGTELERQNKALDHLSDDVDELNSRVKGANKRATHLLKK